MHDIRQNPNPEPRPEPQLKPDVGPAGSGKAADAAAGTNTPVSRQTPSQPAPSQAPSQPVTPQPPAQAAAPAQPPARPAASGLSGGWDNDGPETRPMSPGVSYEVTGTAPAGAPPPPPAPEPAPVTPVQPAAQTAAATAPAGAPAGAPTAAPAVSPHEHRALAKSLQTIKRGLISLIGILAFTAVYFLAQSTFHLDKKPTNQAGTNQAATSNTSGAPNSGGGSGPAGTSHPISCVGQTGTDASTDSKSFTDIEGTECAYRTGSTPETLVLNGKLTGRNTEGTGMSVTINVNGKVCNGGESLNYARTFTPMLSNCVFDVPANSSVAIKWQFLSPFGGSASVLRSSKNIAPSITGVAIPKDTGSSSGG